MIMKAKWGNQNHSAIEEKTTLVTLMTTTNIYQFQNPRKYSKMKKAGTNKDFSSHNRFEILQGDIKESNHDLTKMIQSIKRNLIPARARKNNVEQTHKNKSSYDSYFRRLNIKKCMWKYHFKGCKV